MGLTRMSNKGQPITVKEIVCENIQKGIEVPTIVKRVKNRIPDSRINAAQIKFYVNYLFKHGIIDTEQKAQYVGKRGRPEVIIKKIEKRITITDKLKSIG